MENINELCSYYVAFLRSLYLIHQNNHWNSKGENFYGDHLLFERIYKTAQDNADLAAEKCIGLFGNDCITLTTQGHLISKIIEKYAGKEDLIKLSLEAEQDFLSFSEEFYKTIKEQDAMSLGFDDMIMSIASERETSVYLLKQSELTLEHSKDIDMSPKLSARVSFFKRLKNSKLKK